ncbi:MAG: pilus assembly protein N-terminal domain-containing protein [Betaproteobacteria bacterium]|nr:pilus assembly protein N-terminal domain-containing protein [Betaproteobacteria bacterium]
MLKRFLLFLAAGLIWLQFACSAYAADGVTAVSLYVGEVRTLPITRIQRVAIGNGKVITTNVLEKELLLLAEQPGRTSMFIWTADGKEARYDVVVLGTDNLDTEKRLSALLAPISGIKVERVGQHVVVSGATSKANLQRVSSITSMFPQTLNMVREEEVTMRRMVYMKVQIVEMKKSLAENIGVAWDPSIAGPSAALVGDLVTPGGTGAGGGSPPFRIPTAPAGFPALPLGVQSFRPYFGITTSILSKINLAVNNGDAQILATPELSTRSGGEAKFLAGGQIPVVTPASGLNPATVTYKDFGIKLSILPVADDKGYVATTIKTEISTIDNSVAIAGQPGFLTRQTDSEINVQAGQTIVISGLVNNELAKDVTRVPGLSEIPILGALFRSTNFRNNRTDLVIFVTPLVVDPTSTVNRERIDKALDMQDKFQQRLGPKGIVD